MRKMKTFIWIILTILIIVASLSGFNLKINAVYEQSITALESGEYEEAIDGLKWVLKFRKNEEVKELFKVAKYEQETTPIIEKFLKELVKASHNIKTAKSIGDIEDNCKLLKKFFEEVEDLDENNSSELSIYLFFLKESRSYKSLKEDVFNPNEIGRIDYPTSHSDLYRLPVAQSNIPETIEKILNQEQPSALANRMKTLSR